VISLSIGNVDVLGPGMDMVRRAVRRSGAYRTITARRDIHQIFAVRCSGGGAIPARWRTMDVCPVWHLTLSNLIHVSICSIKLLKLFLEVPVLRSVGLHIYRRGV
jgi:hypothetical protein